MCRDTERLGNTAVINRESEKYKVSVEKPGVLTQALTAFADSKPNGTDCKISLDGKKLAYGFGQNLGDEDLGGFEQSPTSKERKEWLQTELESTENIMELLNRLSLDRNIAEIEDCTWVAVWHFHFSSSFYCFQHSHFRFPTNILHGLCTDVNLSSALLLL